MANSDDIFRSITSGSKEAGEALRKTIDLFRQLNSMASKGVFSNPSFGGIPIPGTSSTNSSLIRALSNMNSGRSINNVMSGSAFSIPPPTFVPPPLFTPSGNAQIDKILSSAAYSSSIPGAKLGKLYQGMTGVARNPLIPPLERAKALENFLDITNKRGISLGSERSDKLTYGMIDPLKHTAARQSMQADYHRAMQERDITKRASMLESLSQNSPIKSGRDYEYIQRGLNKAKQSANDLGFQNQLKGAGTPTQLTELRSAAAASNVSNQLLDRIDKKLARLNDTTEKEQKKQERDQKKFQEEHPYLSKILPSRRAVGLAGGLAAVGGTVLKSAYQLTGMQLQAPTQAIFAQAEYEKSRQDRFLSLGGDYSGEGRLRGAGNILLAGKSANTGFLGANGFGNALGMSGALTSQAGQRSILGNLGSILGGAAMTVGGGALMIGGAPTVAGGIMGAGLLSSGLSMLGGGLSDAMGNNAVRATGILGKGMQEQGIAMQNSETYIRALALQQADVDKNRIYSRQIDAAEEQYAANRDSISRMGAKAFTMGAMAIPGGGITNFSRSEAAKYASMDPMQREMMLTGKLASSLGTGNTSWDRATSLGMSGAEYTSAISRTQMALGVGGGGAESTGNALIRLSRSGYGSMEQLLGNMSSLSSLSGKGNSLGDLKAILGAAVASGFDGSRLGQKFVETTTKVASSLGLMDVSSVGKNLGFMAGQFGMGERGLSLAASGMEGFNKATSTNPLISTLVDANLSIQGKLGDATAYSLAHNSPAKQAETVSQVEAIRSGKMKISNASLETRAVIYGQGGLSGAKKMLTSTLNASMPFLSSRPELLQGLKGLKGEAINKYLMSSNPALGGESILAQVQKLEGFGDVGTAMSGITALAMSQGILAPGATGGPSTKGADMYAANNITARAKAQFANQLSRSGMSMLGQTLAGNASTSGLENSAIGRYLSAAGSSGATIGGAVFHNMKEVESAMKLTGKSDTELMAMQKSSATAGEAARALALKDTTVNQLAVQAQSEAVSDSSAQLVKLAPESILGLAMAIAGASSFNIDKDGKKTGK
jgi:hypothetical protein